MFRRIFALLMLLGLVVAGIALSVTLLFKISAITVQGLEEPLPGEAGLYTEEQVVAAFGVRPGDNIFSFRVAEKEQKLETALPLLEKVSLRRKYPGAVEISVQPAVATYCTQTGGGWAVLSSGLRVMALAAEQPEGLTVLWGDTAVSGLGTALDWTQTVTEQQEDGSLLSRTEKTDIPEQAITALAEAELLGELTALDFTDLNAITVLYQNRIAVRLGSLNSLDYKLQLVGYILRNEDGKGCSAADQGVLDAGSIRADGTIQPVFRTGAAEMPYQQRLPAAEPPAEEAPQDAEEQPVE